MDDFNLNFALVKTIKTGDYFLNIEVTVDTVNDLLSQRVFLVLIDHEIGG